MHWISILERCQQVKSQKNWCALAITVPSYLKCGEPPLRTTQRTDSWCSGLVQAESLRSENRTTNHGSTQKIRTPAASSGGTINQNWTLGACARLNRLANGWCPAAGTQLSAQIANRGLLQGRSVASHSLPQAASFLDLGRQLKRHSSIFPCSVIVVLSDSNILLLTIREVYISSSRLHLLASIDLDTTERVLALSCTTWADCRSTSHGSRGELAYSYHLALGCAERRHGLCLIQRPAMNWHEGPQEQRSCVKRYGK